MGSEDHVAESSPQLAVSDGWVGIRFSLSFVNWEVNGDRALGIRQPFTAPITQAFEYGFEFLA